MTLAVRSRLVAPLVSTFLLAACGGEPPAGPGGSAGSGGSAGQGGAAGAGGTGGAAGSGGAKVGFLDAVAADGFAIQEGQFKLVDLNDCCQEGKSCSGNNPASPYAAYSLPRAPGQEVANPSEDANGLAVSYRMRPDEAVVWIGETPPEAAYFGFTDYLVSRDDGTGNRAPVFASLAETLNNAVIGVEGPADGVKHGRKAVIVHAADAEIAERIRAAAAASGISSAAVNIAPIDAATTRLGTEVDDDALGVLFRVALFADPAAGKAWLDAPPAEVYRLTPTVPPAEASPYGVAPARPKDTSNDENITYSDAAAALEQAIIAAHSATHSVEVEDVGVGLLDPYACIEDLGVCAGDNRDTVYPSTGVFLWLPKAEDFIVVHGVNHAETGKATYASASVYAIEHLVGVASVTSAEWKGSASVYLPDHPLVDKLFAYKIARACNGEAFCLEVPDGTCPDGINPGKLAFIAFRAYMEPATSTAPDSALLVRDGVLRFKVK